MSTMAHRIISLGIAQAVGVAMLLVGSGALAQQGQQELNRETARQISNAIARRIEETLSLPVLAEDEDAEERRNALWGTASYTTVVDDDLGDVDFEINLLQSNLGVDRRFGPAYLGVAASAAHADFEGSLGTDTAEGDIEIAAVTPYGAFLISDHVYITTLAQVLGAFIDGEATGDDFDISGNAFAASLVTEVAMNGVFSLGNWRSSARAGHRLILVGIPLSDSEIEGIAINTFLLGGKVGYQIDKWQPYVQVEFEDVFPDIGPELIFLFIRPGVTWRPSDRLSFGLEGNVEVANKETTTFGGQLNFRWKF